MAQNSNFQNVIPKNTELCLEILQKQNSLLSEDEVISLVDKWLSPLFPNQMDDVITKFDDTTLSEHVSSIKIQKPSVPTDGGHFKLKHYVYRFNSFSPEIPDPTSEQQISTQWILPTEDFHGLWESLFYDGDIKNELLNYVSTALHFSEKQVDPNIISWNRIILLHGPPGTGKTSLCKALAQKICIRFASKFQYGHFVEVNTHSLFSKWFSESGKLVTKMFHEIVLLLEDPKILVIVLLDEVESLARSRASALNGNEPSDALRVVNALLTHLDMIKRFPNVLILTTSNITEAIDVALVDRADIKQYIGLPSVEAIYHIYSSCIRELQKAEIIITGEYRQQSWLQINSAVTDGLNKNVARIAKLKAIAEKSVGFSGRSLRKMPFIACSLFLKTDLVTIELFLDALSQAVDKHWNDTRSLQNHLN